MGAGPWVGALALAILVWGRATGWPLLQHLGYALLGLDALAYLVVRLSARGVSAESRLSASRVTAGDPVDETVTIANGGRWPALWIEVIEDHLARSFSLWTRGTFSIDRTVVPERRGRYPVGGATVRVRDPLGLFTLACCRVVPALITVYPRPLATPAARRALSALTHARRRSAPEQDTLGGDLRPYVAGDPITRIHWRSSARHGDLLVATPERKREGPCWLLVDLSGDRAEEAASVAAYLAEQLQRSGRPTGAVVAGDEVVVIQPQAARENAGRIADALALTPSSAEAQTERLINAARLCRTPAALLVVSGNALPARALEPLRRITPAVHLVDAAAVE